MKKKHAKKKPKPGWIKWKPQEEGEFCEEGWHWFGRDIPVTATKAGVKYGPSKCWYCPMTSDTVKAKKKKAKK